MDTMTVPVTTPLWDARAGEWRTVTVEVTQEPRRRRTSRRRARRPATPRMPLDHTGSAPMEPYWADTAYAETGPLADMRTWTKQPAMRTHRTATVMPAEPGRITARKPSDRLDT